MKRYRQLLGRARYVSDRDLVRNTTTGDLLESVLRQSGNVELYAYDPSVKRGNPFARPLSSENRERLGELRERI